MARRNHLPPNALKLREATIGANLPPPHHPIPSLIIDDPRLLHRASPPPPPPLPPFAAALVEDRIAFGHREIQALLVDNQRLAATHVALKQELAAAQLELRHLSATAASVKSEADAQIREIHQKSLQMEAELRAIDELSAELAQLKADIQKLTAERKELTAKLQAIDTDLVNARSGLRHFPAIKAEVETMQREIQRGRAAIEYEKEMQATNLGHSRTLENNMIAMAREIEKLRAELANAEKRARAAAAAAAPSPGYAAGYRNPEIAYNESSQPDLFSMHQSAADAGSEYNPGGMPHGSFDVQRVHVHR